jgi:hypothetical protein
LSEKRSLTLETVRDMAKLSILSNRINEVQEKNLKMFPLVMFEKVKSVRVEYDLSRTKSVMDEHETSNSLVQYFLTLDEEANKEHSEKRFSSIEAAIRLLFWSDVAVEVYFNDRIVYKSNKNVKR